MPAACLIDYSQRIGLSGTTGSSYDPLTFAPLVDPLIARRDKAFRVLSQQGEAVAWFGRFKPPAALYPDAVLGDPQVEYERLDDMAWRTTWSYVMAVAADAWADDAAFAAWVATAGDWPTTIEFLE